MADKVFRLIIDVDSRKAKAGAKKAETAIARLNQRVRQVSPYALAAGAALGAMFVRSAIRKAIEQEQALAGVASQIRATGAAAGLSTQQVADYASELQRATGIGDEAILRSSAILLSFKQITGQVFKDTLRVAADLAVVMQTDLNSAILQLSKALADPVARLSELSRSGIIFTDSQKDLIKQLVESGRLLDAQNLILRELESQYGGAAEAARNTLGGALNALKSEFGDLQEDFILESGASGTLRTAVESWIVAIQSVRENMGTIAGVWNLAVSKVLAGLAKLIAAFGSFAAFLDRVIPGQGGPGSNISVWAENLAENLEGMSEVFEDKAVSASQKLTKQLQTKLVPALQTTAKETKKTDKVLEGLSGTFAKIFASPDRIGLLWFPPGTAEEIADAAEQAHKDALRKLELFMQPDKIGAVWFPPGTVDYIKRQLEEIEPEEGLDLEGFAKDFGDKMGQALATAFASGDVDNALDALVNTLAAGISQAVSTAVSAAVPGLGGAFLGPLAGAVAGGLFASLFNDDSAEQEKARLEEQRKLIDSIRSSMSSIEQQIINILENILDLNEKLKSAGALTTETLAAIGREIESAVAAVTGVSVEDFGDRLRAAVHLIERIGQMPADIQEQFEGINLGGLAESIAAEFMGVTSQLDLASIEQSASELRSAISGLGLESKQTAALLRQVREAERLRTDELRAGVLSQLADLMERAGIRSAEAARLRAQYEQIQFQVALKRLEVELKLLDLWTKATAAIIGELTQFANNLGNFVGGVVSNLNQQIQLPRVGGGGRRGRRGRRKQKRKDLLAELERLMDPSTGSLTFADKLKDLNTQFAELRKRAKKLKIPLDKVNEAYKVQLRLLRQQAESGLRDFRDNLLTGPLSPLTTQQRFFMARSRFSDLARRAQAGDLDAISELGSAGQEYLDLARQMFGTTERFNDIFNEVLNLVNGVLGSGGLKDEEETRHSEVISKMEDGDLLRQEFHVEAQDTRRDIYRKTRESRNILRDVRDILERMEDAA